MKRGWCMLRLQLTLRQLWWTQELPWLGGGGGATHDLATNARSTAIPPPPPHTNHKYEEIPGLTKKLYTCQSQHSTVWVAFRLRGWMRFVFEPDIWKKENSTRSNVWFCVYTIYIARLIYHPIINDWFIHSFIISPSLSYTIFFIICIFKPFRQV